MRGFVAPPPGLRKLRPGYLLRRRSDTINVHNKTRAVFARLRLGISRCKRAVVHGEFGHPIFNFKKQ